MKPASAATLAFHDATGRILAPGIAFVKMKERIQRQMTERTNMLAGVSHDLRTPLTRMRLQLALAADSQDKTEFLQDISESVI